MFKKEEWFREGVDRYGRKAVYPKFGKWFGSFVLGVVGLIFLFGSFGTIEAGERGVKTRLGKIAGTVDTGLYFKLPIIEEVHKLDVRTRIIKNELYVNKGEETISDNALEAASKDLQDVDISIVVNYSVDPNKVVEIYQQYKTVEKFEEGVIKPLVKEIVKASSAKYTAEELVTKRDQFSEATSALLKEAISSKFAVFERNNITNIGFSPSFTTAIEAKVTAEQQALTAKNKLEQIKYEAEQTVTSAKAEAESIRIQAQAITQQGGKDYVSLKWIEKWSGILPSTMLGDSVPLINVGR